MSSAELTAIEGIDGELAAAIIERRQLTPLSSWDELADLPGMDQEKLAKLKESGLVCDPPALAAEAARSTETFACRSCGRKLPVNERETSSYFNQHICNACYANLTNWAIPAGGA